MEFEGLNERDVPTQAIHKTVQTVNLCKRSMWMAFSFLFARIAVTFERSSVDRIGGRLWSARFAEPELGGSIALPTASAGSVSLRLKGKLVRAMFETRRCYIWPAK
jgi:hypothetical protein